MRHTQQEVKQVCTLRKSGIGKGKCTTRIVRYRAPDPQCWDCMHQSCINIHGACMNMQENGQKPRVYTQKPHRECINRQVGARECPFCVVKHGCRYDTWIQEGSNCGESAMIVSSEPQIERNQAVALQYLCVKWSKIPGRDNRSADSRRCWLV